MTTTPGSGVWVRFLENYNYRKPAFTIAYKAGMVLNVPSEAATLAIAAGRAVRMRKARKDEEPTYAHVDTREYVEDGLLKAVRLRKPNKDAEPTEWQSSEALPQAKCEKESTYKSGSLPQTSSATKSAADSPL